MKKGLAILRSGAVAALDVGTTKVCCFIARSDESNLPRIVGIGHQVANGVRNGGVVDMDRAEASIRAAVNAAEQMAGVTVRQVLVNASSGHPTSRTIGFDISVSGHEIGDSEIGRVLRQGRQVQVPRGREVIHAIPIGFTIDGSRGIRDPRGMHCERLGVNMHVVSAAAGAMRNVTTCVRRCHLDVEGLVVAPYASGLAALVEDEIDLGVTLIDMGGGTTTLAVFFDGAVVYTDSVPLGGAHVTNDIASVLSTPLVHAERIKTLYGHGITGAVDHRDRVEVPPMGEDDPAATKQIPKSLLVGIIQPRLEEIFELVRGRLGSSGYDQFSGRRVVLTGGASQLPGMRELATKILDKQVRLGRPIRVSGLAEATRGPAFATCAGLITYALRQQPAPQARLADDEPRGLFGRFGVWLRETL